MLRRRTTVSRYGVFQFSPGPATRANFPSRWTMATCAVSTVKKEPRTMLKASRTTMATIIKKKLAMFTLLFHSTQAGQHPSSDPKDGGILPQERSVPRLGKLERQVIGAENSRSRVLDSQSKPFASLL